MERNSTRSSVLTEFSPNISEIEVKYKNKIKPFDRKSIVSSTNSTEILREIWNPNTIEMQEDFILLLLNRNNKLLGWVKISSGGLDGTVCDPKIIFSIALKCLASSIIVAHNHPSGNKNPSSADTQLTKVIKDAGELLGIRLLDHVILTTETYFSYADEGLL